MLSRICLPEHLISLVLFSLKFSLQYFVYSCLTVGLFFFTHGFDSLPLTCGFEYPSSIFCFSSVVYVLFCIYCCLSFLSLSLRVHVWYVSPPLLLKYFGIIIYILSATLCFFVPFYVFFLLSYFEINFHVTLLFLERKL